MRPDGFWEALARLRDHRLRFCGQDCLCQERKLPSRDDTPDIRVLTEAIEPDALHVLVRRFFTDMVKFVADVEHDVVAIGGELHADAEAVLLDRGSRQQDLWGANYYPGRGPDGCIEYTALINIRPSQGNRSMEIEDPSVRSRVRELAFRLIGRGESLP